MHIARRRLIVIGMAVIVVLAIFVAARSCAPAPEPEPSEEEVAELAPSDLELIDEEHLRYILGPELSQKLVESAQDNEDLAWIAAHPEAFEMDGASVQHKLLKLATKEPEAVSFIRTFPEVYPNDEPEEGTTGESDGRRAPKLYQWDPRWGTTQYCATAFALTGCCPTSMAMVYQGLTGKTDKGPYEMGQLAKENGYMDTYQGTLSDFLTGIAPKLGLSSSKIDVNGTSLRSALAQGQLVICNVGPGDFTDGGHFFVITGMDDEGKLLINDPFSVVNTEQHWDVSTVLSQTRGLWAFHA